MAKKYLDENGVTYLFNKITAKIPIKTSSLANDSGFVTETELEAKKYLTAVPSEYVTETELAAKKYLTSVPSEYVTETELTAKGYLTEHQSLSNYYTKTQVDSAITTAINNITNGDEVSY